MNEMGSSADVVELLRNQEVLIARILSYAIEDTKELANLRLVSKDWNANVRPSIWNEFAFRKVCFPTQHSLCEEIVKIKKTNFASRRYMFHKNWFKSHLFHSEVNRFLIVENGEGIETMSILFCQDEEFDNTKRKHATIEKTDSYDFLADCAERFAKNCKTMSETNSFDEFQSVADDAVTEGLFLCLEDLEKGKEKGDNKIRTRFEDHNTFEPVIVTVYFTMDAGVDIVETASGIKIAYMKFKTLRERAEYLYPHSLDIDDIFPFVKRRKNPAILREEDDKFVYPTFAGYNVTKIDARTFSCQVPMGVYLDEAMYNNLHYRIGSSSFLCVETLLRKCYEQNIREGVAIADDFVPVSLHKKLMNLIEDLVKTQIVDYHPHSNDIVRDIVHPALHPYVKGVSPLRKTDEKVTKELNLVGVDRINNLEAKDYWGRPYEPSAKYQWLPTYFEIAEDGRCAICNYINNLVPRSKHEDLYGCLAQLFSQALPLIESVYAYGRVVKEIHIQRDDDPGGYALLAPIEEQPVSLRGKQVQVITKIVDHELGPGQTYEGVWHVEGMSHEEIVATAIYFIDRDDEIEGGDIVFKRAFHRQEASHIFHNVDQIRPQETEDAISEGLQPLGHVKTLPRRVLVFPNSHVHKVTELKNTSTGGGMKKRRIIVFFLINPERRIVSTREVPMQQAGVGGKMHRGAALTHRLELMRERKYAKQDWNVREIDLCEH